MSDPRITDEAVEAVEAAAKAACELVYPPKTHRSWDDVDDFERDCWRAVVRTVLAAMTDPAAEPPVTCCEYEELNPGQWICKECGNEYRTALEVGP